MSLLDPVRLLQFDFESYENFQILKFSFYVWLNLKESQ